MAGTRTRMATTRWTGEGRTNDGGMQGLAMGAKGVDGGGDVGNGLGAARGLRQDVAQTPRPDKLVSWGHVGPPWALCIIVAWGVARPSLDMLDRVRT
eukprot:8798682-Pyramimonas_sp.AAC.1